MRSASRLGSRWITASGALAVVFALVGVAPVASATPVSGRTLTWSGPIRLAHDVPGGSFSSVACPTTARCVAVDTFGREVTYDPTAPADTAPYVLDSGQSYAAVACPGTAECVAVTTGGRVVTFDPLAPANATPRSLAAPTVRGLSCPSTTQCTLVDDAGRELTFDPTGSDSPAAVTIDSGKQFWGVSCPSASQCTAVDNGGRAVTFDPTAPGSPGATTIDPVTIFGGVSCPSTNQCTATAGSQVVTFDPTNVGTPTPVTIDNSQALKALTCPSAIRCVSFDTGFREVTFNPTSPSPATLATVGATYALSGVSCPSTAQCVVVDMGGRSESFDPATTPSASMVLVSGRASLVGVSCPATTQCTVSEVSGRVSTFNPLAPVTPTPVSVAPNGGVVGIVCPSVSQCTVLGSSGETTFNPGSGAPIGSASLTIFFGAPVAIACPAATQCTALADNGVRSTFNPQFQSPATVAENIDSGQVSTALSCASTTMCEAVDHAGGRVTFDPSVSSQATTRVVLDSGQNLSGVYCLSATQCVAVDWIGNEITFNPSAGGPTTPFADTGHKQLAVTCASANLCVSIDDAARVIEGDLTDAAHWYIQALPQAVQLKAVSCPTTTECVVTDAMGNAFVGLAVPADVALPTIAGTTTQGQLLTETNGTWTNNPTGYTHQWEDCDAAGANCTDIPGATASTYTLQSSDAGHTIRVNEIASNALGSGTPAVSAKTTVVLPLPPGNVEVPTISGNTSQGQLLTASSGSWTNNPTSYAYQWEDCDSAGDNCTPIGAATNTTYLLQASDVGHTVRVTQTATNAGGSSDPAPSAQTAVVAPPDTAAPVVQFDAKPASPSKLRTAHFAFSATDASPPVTFTCQLDSAAASACTSPVDLTSLADGAHTFAVTATDAASNASSALSYQWVVDATAPTATLKTPTLPFVLAATATVSWSGADGGSGIGSYQLRYQRAVWNATFGPWTYPTAWQALHVTSVAPTLSAGYTYCYAVRSVDHAGNTSAWTASRCTARPVDDRAGVISTGWVRGTSSAYYLGTYTQTTGLSRTLTFKSARLDRVGIVATKCPTCGVVWVYVGTSVVGKISLYSTTTVHKALVVLPRFSLRTATVVVKVMSSGKLVQLDGLAVSEV